MKRGLAKNEKPQPNEFIIQGSYAMKTTVQHPENDYDIDDGVAFDETKLIKPDDTEMTPLEAKQMVREALIDGGGLRKDPTIKKNCVRVEYAAGHHVDIPVYRRTIGHNGAVTTFKIAGTEWRESNPKDITDWFVKTEKNTKVEAEEEPQLRRMVRLLKMYSQSNLGNKALCGLILTVLAAEKHFYYNPREDAAFRNLLSGIKLRLEFNREVRNPANWGEVLTKEKDEAKIDALVEQIEKTLKTMEALDAEGCTLAQAREIWDKTFNTTYFGEIQKAEDDATRAPSTPSRTEPEKKAYIRGPQTSA
jgi:hypothetical protein